MIYTSLEDIAQAAHEIDLADTEQVAHLSALLRVYFDAMHKAPCDIVGVGKITWAENALVAHQIINPKG